MGYLGILIPEEYEIERFFRDTRINSIGGGTTEILKEVVGRMMGL